MNLYAGLLFLEGHVADPKLMQALAGHTAPAGAAGPPAGAVPAREPAGRPKVCRRGAVAMVCGTLPLSPFR
jgi:hypothetical protein